LKKEKQDFLFLFSELACLDDFEVQICGNDLTFVCLKSMEHYFSSEISEISFLSESDGISWNYDFLKQTICQTFLKKHACSLLM